MLSKSLVQRAEIRAKHKTVDGVMIFKITRLNRFTDENNAKQERSQDRDQRLPKLVNEKMGI